MASNPPPAVEDFCNTETEEETAFKKKRSRRVSFADREITSVHYFNRDEDYETPPDPAARKPSSDGATAAEDEVSGFFRDIAASDDSREVSPDLDDDDGDGVALARRSFLRPIESPSPGSSILGSATSNDEDNFFGPVSASFIRPEQLDDGVSDYNHDVTMDSTVFSMHYRSLARSESGGSTFEEKTPSQAATPSDSGGSMVLANAKKMNPHFSISGKVGSGRDSNDMSLVGPPNYSYEKLSPNLEALLAGSSKDLQDVPVSYSPCRNTSKRNEISMFDDSMDGHVDQRDGRYKKAVNVGKIGLSPQGAPTYMESDEFHGKSSNSLDGLIATRYSSHGHEDLTSNTYVDHQMQTPNQMVQVNSFFGKNANGLVTLNVEFPTGGYLSIDSEVPQLSYVTPSPKQPNSFLGKGNGKTADKLVSANKSVSKIQIYEPSPLTSALKERLGSAKLRLSKFSSTSPYNVVSVESCMNAAKVDAVVFNLEERLSCIVANDKCNERTYYVDSAGIQNQKEYCGFRKDDNTKSLTEEGKCGSSMCTHASFDGSNQLMIEMDSLSQLSQLQKNHRQHNLIPEKCVQQKANVSGSDSSLADIIVDNENNVKEINLPDEVVSPPDKPLEKALSSSTKQCTPLHDLQPVELVSLSLGQDKCSAGKVINNSNSTLATDVSPASFVEERAHSSSPLSVMNVITDINQERDFMDRKNFQTVQKHTFETSTILRSPFRESNTQKIPPGSPDRNMLVATGLIHSGKEVPAEWNKASPPASASCNSRKIKKNAKKPIKRVMSKNLVEEPTHNPSRVYQDEVSGSENVKSFDGTIIVSPISSANCPADSGDHSDNAQNLGKSSERKRKFDESDAVGTDKYRIVNRSPENHTSQDANLESLVVFHNKRKNTRSDIMMKHWSEILQKFSKDTDQLVSPVTENVNRNMLSRMQDVVLHLQKVKFLELLRSQIKSQAVSSPPSEINYDRLAETKMLLYKVAYEKARLQLMRMEREEVLKKSQQLSSAVHKAQVLKLNRPCLFLPASRHSQVDNLRLACNMSRNVELSREKLAAMKHEFEALNRKIENLTKSFNSYLKIKGDPSCSDIIAQLNVHLKKKTACKIIHEDLQLCKVEDFASTNLKQTITLNYRGLFCQRFVINGGPSPSVFVSNNLNDCNIRKNFPSMDARTAFAWVLNARSSKKLVGFKSFAQEIQITCSLLHNMYDVIGEVQLALVELRNLVQTRFHASVEQLQLQLCFIDFNHGWKLMVTLDLTCLNRGVYPSDIVPSQLEASKSGTSILVPDVVSARITAAVDGLRAGYARIIRLCRSISQAMCSPQAH